ncbi:hypothetical protein BJEO58_01537 [Brevibacterium jeotgali]|uniref:Uncharacterized protein n=1 Tax=Brevibacterium jeotgali TaxID=1262550 RepID=A0A2H1L6F5_9MICO|nr:hypothetical protein BJEO58_01537 [Brevibacterium jeotgali]
MTGVNYVRRALTADDGALRLRAAMEAGTRPDPARATTVLSRPDAEHCPPGR